MLLIPIVSATALATHAVIGEKQSKALEPLLATPISTIELLAAKTLTPFLFALMLMWTALVFYLLGAVALGLFVGRELRQRYKFNRRTPYDIYSHSGDEQDVDFGLGV